MQRHLTRAMAAIALIAVFALVAIPAAQSKECSNATLKGSYGLHAAGSVIGVGDFAAVGRFTFDGKGNLTGRLFTNVAGNYNEPPEFTGTYSVRPDCVVTDTWGPPINTTHVSVIVDEGKGYVILNDTSGSGDTISGKAKKQLSDGECSDSILNGSYGLHATGSVIGVGDFAAVGRFTFDQKGNLTGKVLFRVNGSNGETPEFTGTYSVSPDCIVTDDWGGGNTHISVIVNEGKEYFILNPSSDRTVSGEAEKQFSGGKKESSEDD
jgi:hypothetical protein